MVRSTVMNCPLCHVDFDSNIAFEEHKTSPPHRLKWLKHWYQNNRKLLSKNKNGVEIYPGSCTTSNGLTFEEQSGTVTVTLQPGSQRNLQLIVKNTGSQPVILRQIEQLHSCRQVSVSDRYGVAQNERFVRVLSGVEYAVECHIQGGTLGLEQVPIAFQFKTEDSDQLFFIVRTMQVYVIDSVAEDCAPSSSYARPRVNRYALRESAVIVHGVPPKKDKYDALPHKIKLNDYRYKSSLMHIAEKNFNPKKTKPNNVEEAKSLRKMMSEGLNFENYCKWFQTMLWIEEMQMEMDIQYYNVPEAQLRKVSVMLYSAADCVELQVPGLAEKRPSVLLGDSVFVSLSAKRKPLYEGRVHKILDKSIYLAFDGEFMDKFIDKMKVSVEFTFNRHNLKVCHRAAILTKELSLSYITFPVMPLPSFSSVSIKPFNRKLEGNVEQMQAVRNIVGGTSKPAPYIVFGPPGTGKTVTVVEAIKQIYKLQPQSRILACAPSNAACDLVAHRLLEHVSKMHMLRMNAASRSPATIPDSLKAVSNMTDGVICFPNDTKLMTFRIIVCTFITAARIVSASLPPGHITHVFLDECGHAMEPEGMAAVAGVLEKDGQVVLAGDPYQLGPVIRNVQCYSSENLFSNNGLDKSLLERLMENPMYQATDGHFNVQVVTKLLNNYRSHKDILEQPNDMFYNSELRVCADPLYMSSLCNWQYLPKKGLPLIFHAVRGKDEREGGSPSYFNTLEVSTVVDYVKKLLDSKNPKVLGKEIGIVTPYRRQVEKIRNQMKKLQGVKDLKVGSPEEFQGDERRVIIISTVRASSDRLADDQFFKLGFLRNPKRFNVSVTRAKALLIIVGCPEILCLDEHWGKLLEVIRRKGGYRGKPYAQGDDDLDDILMRFDSISLRPALGEDVSIKEMAEAPEWRAEQ